MYIYICIYIDIYIHVYVYMYMYIHVYIRICHEAKCQWPELAVNTTPLDQVVVATASRSAGAVYKHLFHTNFPRVGFTNNHGALRTFARHLSSLDALQAMSANFKPMALINTSVYSRNQNLRILES